MKTTPENWYIQVTKENYDILNTWRLNNATSHKNNKVSVNEFVLSKHKCDGSLFYSCDNESKLVRAYPNYVKIDLNTFLEITNMTPDFTIRGTKLPTIPGGTEFRISTWKSNAIETTSSIKSTHISYGKQVFKGDVYVLHENSSYLGNVYYMTKLSIIEDLWKSQNPTIKEMKNYTITSQQAQSIVNIACNTWQNKLVKLWATDIVLNNNIQISSGFYAEMRGACTAEQNKLFDTIFPETNPFKAGDWVKIIQPSTHSTDHVFQLTEDHFENVTFSYDIKYNMASWEYPNQIRLATEDEIKLANFPKDGTACLVSDGVLPFSLRYANGKGEFYNDGRKSGKSSSWKNWRILNMDNLPVND